MKSGLQKPVWLVGLLLASAFLVFALQAGESIFVQVKEAELRSAPSFLSTVEASLEYGDGVTFLADQSGWYQIELSDGQIGWIFSDAVDENRTADIVLQGERQERRTVTSREIALAGRGFSENLEQELSEDQKVDFSAVDELERRSIGSDQLIAFLTEAELRLDALEAAE